MSSFSYKWIDEGGVRILYSRPLGQVSEDNWVEHYEDRLSEYGRDHGFFVVDVYGIKDDFGFEGIKKDMELLRKYHFKSARYALLSNDNQDYLMVKLFNEVARIEQIDAQVKIFTDVEDAKKWLLECSVAYKSKEQCGSE